MARLPRLSLGGGAQGPLIGLIILCVVFSLSSDFFLSVRNALNILDQVTVLGILAIGMTAVIIIGGIDLSVGSVLALSMMMMGWLQRDVGVPLGLAILFGIATGAACGLVSGLLISRARLPAFIATLTMMSVARGLANILTEGRQIVGFADWFTSLATVRHMGFLSATVTLFILLTLVAGAYLRFRPGGRNLYAIGGTFVLRIEDLDDRCKRPELATQLIDDLAWLGLGMLRRAWRPAAAGGGCGIAPPAGRACSWGLPLAC